MSYVNYDKVTRNVDSIYKAVLIGIYRISSQSPKCDRGNEGWLI